MDRFRESELTYPTNDRENHISTFHIINYRNNTQQTSIDNRILPVILIDFYDII